MKSTILVTGGAGYIGSFIVRELAKEGYEVVIVDDLSSGHKEAVKRFRLIELNLVTDKDKLKNLFKNEEFAGVIHMAAFIQMGESYDKPLKYFRNNIVGTLNLLEAMKAAGVGRIVFSSSAGVYGTPKSLPIKEDDQKNPENPYGETKLAIEKILYWCDKAWGLKHVNIRYFNAAGAALDGAIGEAHPNESHIIPLIMKAALQEKKFTIFGEDYDTPDGTCVRDYVHVMDLARAHTLALDRLLKGKESASYNAGSGKGYSNKQIVEEVKRQAGEFNWEFGERRKGDADALYASIDKIKKELGWKPIYGLKEIIKSAYKWHKLHPKGWDN